MDTLIKIDLEKFIATNKPLVVELGCGRKKKSGSLGVDIQNLPNVDIVMNLEKGLAFLPDDCVNKIYCKSVLEHIEDFEFLMKEIARVLKEAGTAHITVPHFSNPYQYSDYSHKRLFGLYTFYYFTDQQYQMKRKVPNFYSDIRIQILSQKLVFTSPFWLKKQTGKLFGLIFNCHRSMQEFYEASCCYLFPCYSIEIIFKPIKK